MGAQAIYLHTGDAELAVAERAAELLEELFGTFGSEGSVMAARATQPLMDGDQVRRTCEVLAGELLAAIGEGDD